MDPVIAIVIVVAVLFLLLFLKTRNDLNSLLDKFKPLDDELNNFKHENSELKAKLKQAKSAAPASATGEELKAATNTTKIKKKKKESTPATEDFDQKKMKEDNFRLNQEVKELRKQVRGKVGVSDEAQAAIAAAQLETEKYKKDFEETARQLALVVNEQGRRAEEEGETIEKAKEKEKEKDDFEKKEAPKFDEAALQKKVKSVRADLSDAIAKHREEMERAHKEASFEIKSVKDELRNFKRQASTQRARADQSHKAFLIIRGQLMVAEQRLAEQSDYTPKMPFPTSHTGIEEALKKHNTRDAREAKMQEDSVKNAAKLQELEAFLVAQGFDLANLAATKAKASKAEDTQAKPAPEATASDEVESDESIRIRRKGSESSKNVKKGKGKSKDEAVSEEPAVAEVAVDAPVVEEAKRESKGHKGKKGAKGKADDAENHEEDGDIDAGWDVDDIDVDAIEPEEA